VYLVILANLSMRNIILRFLASALYLCSPCLLAIENGDFDASEVELNTPVNSNSQALPLRGGESDVNDLWVVGDEMTYTVIKAPLKLRFSPSPVIIITREMIKNINAKTLLDVLRLIPGMNVRTDSGAVNYLGGNALQNRRINLTVDRIPMYRSGLARIEWQQTPLSLENIERIEIIRSPASATYGPNSFQAVVNIKSRNAMSSTGFYGVGKYGDQGDKTTYLRGGLELRGGVFASISGESQTDQGFDSNGVGDSYRSGYETDRFNLRFDKAWSATHSLSIIGAYAEGIIEENDYEANQQTSPDLIVKDMFVGLEWNYNKYTLNISSYHGDVDKVWISCSPISYFLPSMGTLYEDYPSLALNILQGVMPTDIPAEAYPFVTAVNNDLLQIGPDISRPICGETGIELEDWRDTAILQYDSFISPSFRVVASIGANREGQWSPVFFGTDDNVSFTTYFSTVNSEFWLSKDAVFHIGAYYENADDIEGELIAPRAAFNKTFIMGSSRHTLRISSTQSFRTPDFLEQNADWGYKLATLDSSGLVLLGAESPLNFFVRAKSPGNLEPEKVIEREVGYIGEFREMSMLIDLRAFDIKQYKLISEKLSVISFNPTNDNFATKRGAEVYIHAKPANRVEIITGLNFTDMDTSSVIEVTQRSRWTGSLNITYGLNEIITPGFAYYHASNDTSTQRFERFDLFSHFEKGALSFAVGLQHTPNNHEDYLSYPLIGSSLKTDIQYQFNKRHTYYFASIRVGIN